MGNHITKVLVDRLQNFSTSEQLTGRINIDAQKSISYSYSGDQITAIDGSAVGNPSALSNVYHDSNLSGSGTSGSPLGLSSTIVLSSSGASPSTARLSDIRLSLHESGKPDAYYDRSGLQFGRVADVLTTLNSSLKLNYDVGGNIESTTFGINGFTATTYTTTGSNQDTGMLSIYGLSGVNSFGDYKIWDNWRSAKRAQLDNSGNEKSVLDMYIGYNNGTSELYPAYIGFYNPYDGSAFIYQSSIVAWNNNLSAEHPVSAGAGLSGNGTSGSPLCVTGILNEYTSQYASSCFSSDRTSLDILTDEYSGKLHGGGVWFRYGGSVFHSAYTELRPSDFAMHDYTDENSVYMNASSIKMYYNLNDSTASASAEINASVLSSLFAWALNNGWNP